MGIARVHTRCHVVFICVVHVPSPLFRVQKHSNNRNYYRYEIPNNNDYYAHYTLRLNGTEVCVVVGLVQSKRPFGCET